MSPTARALRNAERTRQPPRGLGLPQFEQIGRKRHRIAALVSGGEVGSSAGLQIHLEGTCPLIRACRIFCHVFTPDALAVRHPSRTEHRQGR
jgi:hypothetical protein